MSSPTPTAGRSRSAGSTRGGGCSMRPSSVFGELGYPEASIVKITEAAGVATGHLLPLLRLEEGDLRRARARPEPPRPPRDEARGRRRATTRSSRSCSGSRRTSASPPSTRRSTGSSARPSSSRRRCSSYHYERARRGLHRRRSRRPSAAGEIGPIDPEVTAWALMGLGELVGMRWILWGGRRPSAATRVFDELERIIGSHPRGRASEAGRAAGDRFVPAGAVDDRCRDRRAFGDSGGR